MQYARRFLTYATADGVPRRSFAVGLIVGTVLNVINQGDALIGAGEIDTVKLVLTYMVPYCVATYGAVSFRMRLDKHRAEIDEAGSR